MTMEIENQQNNDEGTVLEDVTLCDGDDVGGLVEMTIKKTKKKSKKGDSKSVCSKQRSASSKGRSHSTRSKARIILSPLKKISSAVRGRKFHGEDSSSTVRTIDMNASSYRSDSHELSSKVDPDGDMSVITSRSMKSKKKRDKSCDKKSKSRGSSRSKSPKKSCSKKSAVKEEAEDNLLKSSDSFCSKKPKDPSSPKKKRSSSTSASLSPKKSTKTIASSKKKPKEEKSKKSPKTLKKKKLHGRDADDSGSMGSMSLNDSAVLTCLNDEVAEPSILPKYKKDDLDFTDLDTLQSEDIMSQEQSSSRLQRTVVTLEDKLRNTKRELAKRTDELELCKARLTTQTSLVAELESQLAAKEKEPKVDDFKSIILKLENQIRNLQAQFIHHQKKTEDRMHQKDQVLVHFRNELMKAHKDSEDLQRVLLGTTLNTSSHHRRCSSEPADGARNSLCTSLHSNSTDYKVHVVEPCRWTAE